MKNVIKVLLLMSIVLFSACESEQKRSNFAIGRLAIQLAASGEVINTTTRSEGDSSGDKGENTEDDDLAPDAGDFTIALMDGNVVKTSWEKFSEYPKYAVLPVGAYTLKAYYGSPDAEGFESPYYVGTQEIMIEDDATVDAFITCYLTNVKVAIEYTDAFKKYFSEYETTVQSAGGKPVNFVKDEVRAAYVKPGDISVYANVKKQNGQSAKLNVLDIAEAKAREFYRLTLDVDAGSSTLKISFDNTTVDKPIEINISDEVLNMQPPFFTRSGYESGVMQEVIEGGVISPLSMLITARNGIKKCVLNTQSTSLIAQGWPVSIDLVNVKEEDLQKMNALGLAVRGLSTNVDKMATLDFSEVIPYLQYISGDDESSFSLMVTDKIGRVNETEEVIKVKTLDNQFAVGTVENVDLGVYEVTVPVTLKGDKERVKFQYLNGEVWTDINVSNITTEGDINHKVTLALPFMATGNFEVKVAYGARSYLVPIGVNPPMFTVTASEADVWATKASITLIGINEGTTEYLKTQPVVIEYIESAKLEGGSWITPAQTKEGNVIEITGLPADAEKENTYRVKAVLGDKESANILDITTEIAAQVPNAGFEDWSESWLFKNTIFLSGGEDIYTFYPYIQIESDKWWSSRNDKTTQEYSGVASWYYSSYPGTVPIQKTSWTAYNHLNKHGGQSLKLEAHAGNNAMEIATVGHGANRWLSQSSAQNSVDFRTAGSLFIGTFDRASQNETLGHLFGSRPSCIEFYYKFYSYNNESAKAYAVLYDEQKQEIGRGDLIISRGIDIYTKGIIDIEYTVKKRATYITIVFLSSNAESPETLAIQGNKGAWNAGYGDSRHIGSVLTVDDVKLIY